MRKKNTWPSMTAEEKEMLRILMETPGAEKEWFFKGMSTHMPCPEFFMQNEPEPLWLIPVSVLLIIISIATLVIQIILNWGRWFCLILLLLNITSLLTVFLLYYRYKHK